MSDIGKTVIALQGNSVKREILGSNQDGYVLTWVNSNNQWQSKLNNYVNKAVFGDGFDGNALFDGVNVPNGSTYAGSGIYNLSRDVYYQNMQINSGITLHTYSSINCRIFVNNTLIIDGNIIGNGNSSISFIGASNLVGNSGSVGGSNGGINGSSTFGGGGSNVISFGGSGGFGGNGSAGTGGTICNATNPTIGFPHIATQAVLINLGFNVSQIITGGASGSGGGGDGTNDGYGGGGGGVPIVIVAQNIIGSGLISSNGGNGGSAITGDCGGGGGGGAGWVAIIYGVNNFAGTITVNGGNGGVGFGIGTNGGNGSNGNIYLIST